MEFGPFFESYELLVGQVEDTFKKVSKEYAAEVRCGLGCSDCCFALFDMSLVESIYIKHKFDQRYKGNDRSKIIQRANNADRTIYRIKKQAYKDLEKGEPEERIISKMALERVRCPLLDDEDHCLIYDIRPITCRLYGIPTRIQGKARVCGEAGFKDGEKYPVFDLDSMYQKLYVLSKELLEKAGQKETEKASLLISVSKAIQTPVDNLIEALEVPGSKVQGSEVESQ